MISALQLEKVSVVQTCRVPNSLENSTKVSSWSQLNFQRDYTCTTLNIKSRIKGMNYIAYSNTPYNSQTPSNAVP